MRFPTRSACALAAALLALAVQWCGPLAHAAHERAVQSEQLHPAHTSHDHDAGEGSDDRHDESTCPTCRHLLALRAFTPTVAPVTLAAAGVIATGQALQYVHPFVSHRGHAPAVPRGPPLA